MSQRTAPRNMFIKGGIKDISPNLKLSICVLLFALSRTSGAQISDEKFHPPEFVTEQEITAESGYFKLEWKTSTSNKTTLFEVQEAPSPSFKNPKTVYKGPQKASFISGIPDGKYYFRIRQIQNNHFSNWSDPVSVRVKHHSLSFAWLLFFLGSVVFIATAVLVIHGSIQSAKENE